MKNLRKEAEFPIVDHNGQIAIAACRVFWKCEQAVNSQNSIASLTPDPDILYGILEKKGLGSGEAGN